LIHGDAARLRRWRRHHGRRLRRRAPALALTGSGDLIWDWDVSADKVFTSPETESLLGLKRGTLEGPAAKWLEVLHPLDQDRFRAASTACSTSAAAGWCRISACARPMATSCGSR